MAQLTSKRYARALFDIAIEKDMVLDYYTQSVILIDILKANNEVFKLLNSPRVIFQDKIAFIEKIFKNRASDDFIGLFVIVIKKNRQNEMIDILDAFGEMVRNYKGITTAYVKSAIPLSNDQVANLASKIESKINKQVELIVEVDADLIAGIMINVDGYDVDLTVKSQLENIKKELMNIKLA